MKAKSCLRTLHCSCVIIALRYTPNAGDVTPPSNNNSFDNTTNTIHHTHTHTHTLTRANVTLTSPPQKYQIPNYTRPCIITD